MPTTLTIMISRGTYGEIVISHSGAGTVAPSAFFAANRLLDEAIGSELLPKTYIHHMSRTRSNALNYAIYDFSPEMVLVQQRFTETSRYGNSTRKNYYIISRGTAGVTTENVEYAKYLVVRTAKADLPYGYVLERVIHRREVQKMAALKRMKQIR